MVEKFNTKQKALLISIVAVIIVALAILAAVVSKPNMVFTARVSDNSRGRYSEGSSGWREHFLSDVSGWTDLLCRCKDEAAASILLGKMIYRARAHPLIMFLMVDSVRQRQTRQRNTKFICRNILLNSWKPCQMLKVLL